MGLYPDLERKPHHSTPKKRSERRRGKGDRAEPAISQRLPTGKEPEAVFNPGDQHGATSPERKKGQNRKKTEQEARTDRGGPLRALHWKENNSGERGKKKS